MTLDVRNAPFAALDSSCRPCVDARRTLLQTALNLMDRNHRRFGIGQNKDPKHALFRGPILRSSLPLALTGIELKPGRSQSKQLYGALRELIIGTPESGGCKLPASRDLAAMLAVSRNTVVNVYERLYSEGFVEPRIGDGTYVADLRQVHAGAEDRRGPVEVQELVNTRQNLAASFDLHPVHDGAPRAFRIGMPAIDQFPFEVWSRLQARFWRRLPTLQMGYGDPAGDLHLRTLISHYLHNARGLRCDVSQILITSGAQQAISLCAALLLRNGDEVVIENPCYWAAAGALSCFGAKLQGVGVDEEGLITAELAGVKNARIAYVSPSCQYPTGATLSLSRRLELLRWAQERHAWIIEDDYDGEYRYSGTPLTPLAALDQSNRVLYVGSFSKVMYPGLRLGYMVAPPQLVEQLTLLRTMSDRQPPISDQVVMASFIAEGHFQQHIRRMRRAGLARRDALRNAWDQHLNQIGSMTEVSSGLHVLIRLPSAEREGLLIRLAKEAGVEITALSPLWLPGSKANEIGRYGLILGFAGIPTPDICRAVVKLKSAWQGVSGLSQPG